MLQYIPVQLAPQHHFLSSHKCKFKTSMQFAQKSALDKRVDTLHSQEQVPDSRRQDVLTGANVGESY